MTAPKRRKRAEVSVTPKRRKRAKTDEELAREELEFEKELAEAADREERIREALIRDGVDPDELDDPESEYMNFFRPASEGGYRLPEDPDDPDVSVEGEGKLGEFQSYGATTLEGRHVIVGKDGSVCIEFVTSKA